MNSIAIKLIEAYDKIKEAEWNSPGYNPPDGLDNLGMLTDDVFILYHTRRYLRLKLYPDIFTSTKGKWVPQHFSLLQQLITLHRPRITRIPPLNAYVRVLEAVSQPATDVSGPDRIKDLLTYLRTNQQAIATEDFVDILSAIGTYCTIAENDGLRHYTASAFSARLLMVEHKYGASWKRPQSYLPLATFFNTVKQGLLVKDQFIWNVLEIDFIEVTEKPRSVHEWFKLFGKAYRSRVAPADRKFVKNYLEAAINFDQGNYVDAAKYLERAGTTDNELIDITLMMLNLILIYELATTSATNRPVHVRNFNNRVDRDIKQLVNKLSYLENNKDKFPADRVAVLQAWLKGYSCLRNLYAIIVTKGNVANPVAQAALVAKKRKALPPAYFTYEHPRKVWLDEAFAQLASLPVT